ncbi:unnamed protein product [Cunninghamella blakesleeana]
MNNIHNLPTELTWNVFQRLSQRDLMNGLGVNGMWYAAIMQFRIDQATIEFCTANQLQRFITDSNEAMTFDLCKIILHFPIDNHIRLVSTLIRLSPRLQQIKTENDGDPYPFSIIRTPTHISFNHVNFWYRNSFIMNINEANARRRQLRTLDYSLGSNLPSNASIRLQSIGTMKSRITRNSIQVVIDFYNKVLLMPTLSHLVSLKIVLKGSKSDPDRYEYEMDERILRSINHSCPNLESIYLIDYFMNISDEYNDIHLLDNNNNGIQGIQGLKSFGMTGAIFDTRCCFLFNLMYPQLESFQYIYSYEKVNDYDSQYLQFAFRDMITQFTSLKRLSLRSISYDDTDLCKYWPDSSFIEFLNNHPDRLVSLDYPDCLYSIASNSTGGDRIYYNNNIISNGLFFNRLFSLIMRPKQLIETVMNYLLHNDNKLTISESINELKIYDTKHADNNGLYLLDWLVLFPALDTFKIDNQVLVDSDNSDDVDGGDKLNGHYIYNGSSKVLHRMIDTRKQQDGIGYNKTGLYKLKTLELNNVKIKYINEMTSLFANFSKLSRLILRHIHYSHIGWHATSDLPRTITSICLDMSHLSLDYLLITDVRIYSWQNNLYYLERLVKKIILFERSTGKKSNCNYDPPSGARDSYYRALSRCHPNDTFTLNLTCHDVDQFIFH